MPQGVPPGGYHGGSSGNAAADALRNLEQGVLDPNNKAANNLRNLEQGILDPNNKAANELRMLEGGQQPQQKSKEAVMAEFLRENTPKKIKQRFADQETRLAEARVPFDLAHEAVQARQAAWEASDDISQEAHDAYQADMDILMNTMNNAAALHKETLSGQEK